MDGRRCARLAGAGQLTNQPRRYDPNPHYPPVGQNVRLGWPAAVDALPATPLVLALDGPAVLQWDVVVSGVSQALADRHRPVSHLDVRTSMAPWTRVVRRTAGDELADDPVFAPLATGTVGDLFDSLPRAQPPDNGVLVVFGPGAALVEHDVLWYIDLPKRYAEAAVSAGTGRNLGQPPESGPGTTRRLFYIDWPLLDRHRETIAARVDCWIDVQNAYSPTSLDGATVRSTLAQLASQPFRTRPTFNSTSWGGHWGQRQLGFNADARNTALGYELIAPESGVLVGDDDGPMLEVPFQTLVSLHARQLMGERAAEVFGTSFPIRFDYLDTVDGGNLSVHCHPRSAYMSQIFGWPYTQHESYYLMVGGEGSKVFLGLREGVDVAEFHRDAHQAHDRGKPFDIEKYVQTFPAEAHQLFLVPAGTPHASGVGNVVLEVSATPYLYSLRFYDWLRRDADGKQRPVHVEHAFRNLDIDRHGEAVARDLVQAPRTMRTGRGWREELLGSLPDMFFEVRRMVVDPGSTAEDDATAGFHVLNVVGGGGVLIDSPAGRHTLAYAETLVVPASVGRYRLRNIGPSPALLVKAQLR